MDIPLNNDVDNNTIFVDVKEIVEQQKCVDDNTEHLRRLSFSKDVSAHNLVINHQNEGVFPVSSNVQPDSGFSKILTLSGFSKENFDTCLANVGAFGGNGLKVNGNGVLTPKIHNNNNNNIKVSKMHYASNSISNMSDDIKTIEMDYSNNTLNNIDDNIDFQNDNNIPIVLTHENNFFVGGVNHRSSLDITNNVDELCHILEILSTFLTGQKDIYMLSKKIVNFRQNLILIFSIVVGGISTILATMECNHYSLLIITVLNTVVALLIGIAGIYKFDVKGENFLHISNSYNKLEMYIENSTSKIQLFNNKVDREIYFLKQMKFVEESIGTIKSDNDSYEIPHLVVLVYPILTKINIFKFLQINYHLRNSLYYNSNNNDIEVGNNVFETFEDEIYNEIKEADKYKIYWFLLYFMKPQNKNIYDDLVKYKLL